ncbi:hypothetical protein ACERJO_08720 [Halalkalibacter sp. AB-rgal2]|uniref:hypothetical protein n=1 Tax=Halalkalibacter sp. AB-rgal2 TaxID=3242695 RepID=UPI00359E90B6
MIKNHHYLKYGAFLFVSSPMLAIALLFDGMQNGLMIFVVLLFFTTIRAISLMLFGYYKGTATN